MPLVYHSYIKMSHEVVFHMNTNISQQDKTSCENDGLLISSTPTKSISNHQLGGFGTPKICANVPTSPGPNCSDKSGLTCIWAF